MLEAECQNVESIFFRSLFDCDAIDSVSVISQEDSAANANTGDVLDHEGTEISEGRERSKELKKNSVDTSKNKKQY